MTGWNAAGDDDDRPGLVRRDHGRTAHAAAKDIESVSGAQRRAVYQALLVSDGLTDGEIQIRLDLDPSSERPRRVELVRDGLVVDSGRTRLTQSGRRATVWVAVKREDQGVLW